jgi:putative hydrolase of the HAD superfamily
VIRAVLLDLDDTLFPQSSWLDGAIEAVADAGATFGADRAALHSALCEIVEKGSDRGLVIDRALARCGCSHIPVPPLVDAFRMHAPRTLRCYPGVEDALVKLRARVPVAIVTDGDTAIQERKLRALGITADVVVFSDADGREHRKPDALPFRRALAALAVGPDEAVFVGDRPDKDILGALRIGMRAIRVSTGEYAAAPDCPQTWATVPAFARALGVIWPELAPREHSAERHTFD